MKAPILFEEAPPTTLGAILGLGVGTIFVIMQFGFHSQIANAVFVAMTSLGILLVCFWSMRYDPKFWLVLFAISGLYCYLVHISLLKLEETMGYEIYSHIVILSLIQISTMCIFGIVIRHRQAES